MAESEIVFPGEEAPEAVTPPAEPEAPQAAAEVTPEETPQASEVTPEEVAPAAPTEEPVTPKPTRAERRIRDLSAKLAQANTASQPAAPVAPVAPAPAPQLPTIQQVLPPGEYTPEQMQDAVQSLGIKTGQALSSIEVQQLRQEIALERETNAVRQAYNDDLSYVESQYPELKENSQNYDSELASLITETFEDQLLANPKTASLKKVADRFMTARRKAAAASGAQAAASVAGAKNSGALAPTAASPSKAKVEVDPFLKGFLGE